jgi:PAS domain S-box-containing protein
VSVPTRRGDGQLEPAEHDTLLLRAADEALHESDEGYQLLHETMLQGVVYQDADGTILSMNPAAERILGKGPDDFIGRSSVAVEHDTLREDGSPFPGLEHPSMVALRTGKPVPNVLMQVYNPREERYRLINIQAVPLLRPGEQSAYCVYAVFDDVTERKQLEKELRETEERLQRIARAGGIGFVEYDVTADEAYWSREHYELFGFEPGSHVDWRRWFDGVHPEDRERVEANAARLLERAAAEGGVQGHTDEYRFVRPDGTVVWIGADMSADLVDGRVILRGALRDVTDRRQGEEALRESEERYRSLAENLPAVLMRYSRDLRVRYLSPLAELITGVPPDQFIGRTNREVGMPEDLCDLWEEAISRVFESGKREELEFSFQTQEGEEKFFLLQLVPESGREGEVSHVLGISTDVSERHRAETALRDSEARYRAIVELADEDLALSPDGTYSFGEGVADDLPGGRRKAGTRFQALATGARRHRLGVLLAAIALELSFLIPMGLSPTSRHVLGMPGSILTLIVVITAALTGWQIGLAAALAGGLVFWGTVADFGAQSAPVTTLISTGIWAAAALISGLVADTLRDQTRQHKSAAVALARAETLRQHDAERAAQAERIRIASDLHDSVTQSLFAATLKAEALTIAADCAAPTVTASAEEVRRLSRGALAQMRTLLLELRGDRVEEVPLHQLLRNLVEAAESRASVKVTLALHETSPLTPKVHAAVYRIVQEALNNVARHAKAQNAWVRLDSGPSHARLLIGDDGHGFDPDAFVDPTHMGLRSMRERACDSDGELTLTSIQGEGTTLVVEWRLGGRETV